MLFAEFAQKLEAMAAVSARLAITDQLSQLFRQFTPAEAKLACYLLMGRLSPEFEPIEFQLSVKQIVKALSRITAQASSTNLFGEQASDSTEAMTSRYKKLGDLGELAAQVVGEQKLTATSTALGITDVFERLLTIATASGAGSQERKLSLLQLLLAELDPASAKFAVRVILGKLRIGLAAQTVLDGLSWAATDDKRDHDLLESAYQKRADLGSLAEHYLANCLSEKDQTKRQLAMSSYSVLLGTPLMPALCQRLNSAAEIIDKMTDVLAEPKYDGMRVQIHYRRGQLLRVFTRGLEDVTPMYPELQKLDQWLSVDTIILDGEAIGFDATNGDFLPFQQTIKRKRKHDVETVAATVPLQFYVFDAMLINDQALLEMPLLERKQRLAAAVVPNQTLLVTEFQRFTNATELHNFHQHQLSLGLEGAVIKQVDSSYTGGRTGWRWVKIKEAEGTSGKLADTLDVIVMGYYRGRGKRTSFGLGAILTGVLDESGQVVSIAKIGTGLTEATLSDLTKQCDALGVKEKPTVYASVPTNLEPDQWVAPELVLEVAADELTKSPSHAAGWALRFPRLIKQRQDKTWQQATQVSELANFTRLTKKGIP